jgi:hypothetical protein
MCDEERKEKERRGTKGEGQMKFCADPTGRDSEELFLHKSHVAGKTAARRLEKLRLRRYKRIRDIFISPSQWPGPRPMASPRPSRLCGYTHHQHLAR